jgi:hypothetical protein
MDIKGKLIFDWRSWWRLWSVRIHGAMAAIIGGLIYLIENAPKAMIDTLNSLPSEMRSALPFAVTIIVFGIGLFGRLYKQKKPDDAEVR